MTGLCCYFGCVTGCKVANIRKDGKVELGLGIKKNTKAQLGQYKELGYVPMYKMGS
jgi:hypothetical protein